MNTFWPDACLGGVSLTFDDAARSQLTRGIPILEEHELLGTFYVNPSDAWIETVAPWRSAADRGHEIGNHTLRHPCSENFSFVTPGAGLESMTLAEIEADIEESERRLSAALPAHGERSFCYPCYQSFVGRGENRASYVPIVAKRFLAGRGWGEWANDPALCDLAHVGSWPCEGASAAEMIGEVAGALAQGRWAILTFHGIQEDHLTVAESDFRELCAHLARSRDRIWTAPTATIARHILDRRASSTTTQTDP